MKLRLHAGTINHWPDEKGFRNYHVDISPRPIWDRSINMAVLPDFVADIASLNDFRPGTFDEIRCHHVLEHLARARASLALEELHRVLKPGGTLDIEVPDVGKVCKAWLYDDLGHDGLVQWLYGEELPYHEPTDSHRYGWTGQLLRAALTDAGFEPGDEVDAGLACRFVAVKPE